MGSQVGFHFAGDFQIVGVNIERLEEKECQRCHYWAKDCFTVIVRWEKINSVVKGLWIWGC